MPEQTRRGHARLGHKRLECFGLTGGHPNLQHAALCGSIRHHAARPHAGDSGPGAANTHGDLPIAKPLRGKPENLLSGYGGEAFGHGRQDLSLDSFCKHENSNESPHKFCHTQYRSCQRPFGPLSHLR
ncbi:hypothetical protein RV134_10046 [Roseovarius sp. EC-HK134]|nr:hypothetical protein RV134_10046 [Roseovarius sp. EC-HK134]VVT33830.1 hypothetical protein RV420_50006 [Roseovarius sp. EC-SD190]